MGKIEFSGVRDFVKCSLKTLRHVGPDRLFLYGVRYLSWKLQFHRLIRSLPNPIATSFYVLIRGIVRRVIESLNKIFPYKYTDADPYKKIPVDPSSINHTTEEIFSKRRGWVVNGEWDKKGEPYMQRTYAKAIEQRLVEGLAWRDTVLADEYDEAILEERAESIERLYQHIREDGYKSQQQLLEEDPDTAWSGLNDTMHPLANEIAVDIGRDGEILWNMCGQHRLAIAKILEIDRIPVQVFRRHRDWQSIRDRTRQGKEIPVEIQNHPDLADIRKFE